jgi:hypothetical protein
MYIQGDEGDSQAWLAADEHELWLIIGDASVASPTRHLTSRTQLPRHACGVGLPERWHAWPAVVAEDVTCGSCRQTVVGRYWLQTI